MSIFPCCIPYYGVLNHVVNVIDAIVMPLPPQPLIRTLPPCLHRHVQVRQREVVYSVAPVDLNEANVLVYPFVNAAALFFRFLAATCFITMMGFSYLIAFERK